MEWTVLKYVFFFQTTRPIKTKLSTKSWGKGDLSFLQIKGKSLFQEDILVTLWKHVDDFTCNQWTQYLTFEKMTLHLFSWNIIVKMVLKWQIFIICQCISLYLVTNVLTFEQTRIKGSLVQSLVGISYMEN